MSPDSDPARISASMLMVANKPNPTRLRRAVMSFLQQTASDCSLLIAAATEQSSAVEAVLEWARGGKGIGILRTPPDTSAEKALDLALEQSDSDWVAVMGQNGVIEPVALQEVLAAAEQSPEATVIYTDSDVFDADGRQVGCFARPDWSPRRLRGHAYVGGLVAVSRRAILEVGGLRIEFERAALYDLLLRVTERGDDVVHLSRVLYHEYAEPVDSTVPFEWDGDPDATEAGRQAVQEHLDRLGIAGTVRPAAQPGFYLTELMPRSTLVSLLMPTRGSRGVVRNAEKVLAVHTVRSLAAHAYSCEYELVVIHDTDADRDYLSTIARLVGDRLKVVDYDPPFNFSAKINTGVEASAGDVLVLLNDDVEVITPRWLDQLVALAQEPDVGAAGAMLLFEDGTVQHAGHYFDAGGIGHIGSRRRPSSGDHGSNLVDREVVGVTAAVLAQRREIWEEVGGLDESLPNNFNDVDYCERIRSRGYRIVQANSVRLNHFESKTRDHRVASWEIRRIQDRLGDQLLRDPFTSVNAADVLIGKRGLAELIRVSRHVLREEGPRSFAAKARKRLTLG